jgi:hypothetical protein
VPTSGSGRVDRVIPIKKLPRRVKRTVPAKMPESASPHQVQAASITYTYTAPLLFSNQIGGDINVNTDSSGAIGAWFIFSGLSNVLGNAPTMTGRDIPGLHDQQPLQRRALSRSFHPAPRL